MSDKQQAYIDIAVRISSHLIANRIWTSVQMKDDLEQHNKKKNVKSKIEVLRSYWVTESHDMNGNKVKLHQHGYVRVSGVSFPTFRKIFKKYILKLDEYVKHKRGNSLYSISKVSTNQGQYCSYISKNLLLDENPDTYLKNPSWYGFTLEEISNVLNCWLKMKNQKDDFCKNKDNLGKEIKLLEERFKSSTGIWIKNRDPLGERRCESDKVENLTLEFVKLYLKYGVQWKKYQVESKMNLWWYTRYPAQLEQYIKNLF